MKVKIINIRVFEGKDSKKFTNYQISIKGKKMWVSELDYASYPDFLIVENDYITLKNPLDEYYELVEKQNKKGLFSILLPKNDLTGFKQNRTIYTNDSKKDANGDENINTNIPITSFFEILKTDGYQDITSFDEVKKIISDKTIFFKTIETSISQIKKIETDDIIFDFEDISEAEKNKLLEVINFVQNVAANLKIDLENVRNYYVNETNSKTELQFILKGLLKVRVFKTILLPHTALLGDTNFAFEILKLSIEVRTNLIVLTGIFNLLCSTIKGLDNYKIELSEEECNEFVKLYEMLDKFNNDTEAADFLNNSSNVKNNSDGRTKAPAKNRLKTPTKPNTRIKKKTILLKPNAKLSGDKTSFINELLKMSNRENVSEKTRERVIDLVSKEIGGNDNLLTEIYKDVKEIKKRVFENDTSNHKEQEKEKENLLKAKEKSQLPNYINPTKLYSFLFNYNQNPILKYTCHDIDSSGIQDIIEICKTEQYDFGKHIEIIKETYFNFEKKHYAPAPVRGLIRGYLTGKDYKGYELMSGWSSDRIKINWSHQDIKYWSAENPGFPPNPSEGLIEQNEKTGFEINRFISVITGKPVQNFRELVIHFKNLFHIRRDNSLKDLIEYKNLERKWNQKIEFIIEENEFPKNIEFFTDVDKLMQSYTKIIELIIEQNKNSQASEKPRVKILFAEKENSLELSIHHLNSVYGKTIENSIERTGQAYTNLIRNQINGLCNFYVRADFGQEKYAKINIWNGEDRESQMIDSFNGVEYLFEFPKK